MSYVRVPERLQINTIFRVFKDLIVFFLDIMRHLEEEMAMGRWRVWIAKCISPICKMYLRKLHVSCFSPAGGERVWSMLFCSQVGSSRRWYTAACRAFRWYTACGAAGKSHGRRDDDPSTVNCEIWHWICNTLCALLWRGSVWNREGRGRGGGTRWWWGIVAKQGCPPL